MFSLVVPTFNRPLYLQRLLNYYSDLEFDQVIVVADSSSGKSLAANEQVLKRFNKTLNVTHRVFSADTNPYAKLANTIDTLQTPFVAICADDDFLVPASLKACVEFLEGHADYSVAHGRATAVLVPDTAGPVDESEIRGASEYPQRTIDQPDPLARLRDHLRDYTATYYSVHRKSQLTRNLQLAHAHSVDFRFGELLASCLSLIQGKAKRLEVLYMVRQAELGPATKKYSEKMLTWDALVLQNDFSSRLSEFRKCLVAEILDNSDLSVDDLERSINRSFLLYLVPVLQEATLEDGPANHEGQRVLRLIKTLPAAARTAFIDGQVFKMAKAPRNSYRQVLNMKDELSLPSLLNPRSPFHHDFISVYKHFAMTT